ncbi:hypothetical protein BDZ91DRAFT_738553 [Kalaharituber pfeilii]|nr:hypothetical protein BDZ91DRAFT_738553 [Kalaharituber pfeilii]
MVSILIDNSGSKCTESVNVYVDGNFQKTIEPRQKEHVSATKGANIKLQAGNNSHVHVVDGETVLTVNKLLHGQ